MGYEVLHVTGDGDCFFHAVAVLLQIREDKMQIPLSWLIERPGADRPTYHYRFHKTSVQVRQTVAEWLAKKILATDLETIVDAWDGVFGIEDIPQIGDLFRDPDFSVVSEADWLQGVPDPLQHIWLQGLSPKLRSLYMSFYIYWYTKTYRDVDGDKWWTAMCLWMNIPDRYCIWGHFDTNDPSAHGATAGFASRAVLEEFNLVLQPIAAETDWTQHLILQDASLGYVLHSPGHFNPLVWFVFQLPTLLDHHYGMEQSSVLNIKEEELEKTASRHLSNSVRDPFMLGIVVWNVNHLAKTPKNASNTSITIETESFPTSSAQMQTKEPFDFFSMEQQEGKQKDKEKGVFLQDFSEGEELDDEYSIDDNWLVPDSYDSEDGNYEDDDYEDYGGKKPKKSKKIPDDTKNQQKVKAIGDLFDKQGAWMNLLALNEVNLGIDRIEKAAAGRYTVHRGPQMIAVGALRTSTQKEYYPLLINTKNRGFDINYVDCIAISADGEFKAVDDDAEYRWIKVANALERDAPTKVAKKPKKKPKIDANEVMAEKLGAGWWKNLPNHRPVVVHRLDVDGIAVNVAIVHTTPGGTEFERILVFSQLREFFRNCTTGMYDRAKGDLWFIGGDFYLYSESVVIDQGMGYMEAAIGQEQSRGALTDLWKDMEPVLHTLHDGLWDLYQLLRKQVKERVVNANLFPNPRRKSASMKMTRDAYEKSFNAWIVKVKAAWERIADLLTATDDPPTKFWQKFELCWESIEEINRIGPILDSAQYFERTSTNLVNAALEKFKDTIDVEDTKDEDELWLFEGKKDEEKEPEKQEELISKKRKLPSWMTDSGKQEKKEEKKDQDTEISIQTETEKETGGEKKEAKQNEKTPIAALKKPRRRRKKGGDGDDDEDEADERIEGESYFVRNRAHGKQPMHVMRNVSGTTFAGQIGSQYRIYQPIWGTNIHVQAPNPIDTSNPKSPKVESLRLADFIVCSKPWQSGFIGLVHHTEQGVLRVDDDAVTTSQYWRGISDHFPVGGRFSVRANDLRVMHIVIEDLEGEKKKARGLLYFLEVYDKLRRRYFMSLPNVDEELKNCFEVQSYPKAFSLLAITIAKWVHSLPFGNVKDLAPHIGELQITDDPDKVFTVLCELTAIVLS